MAQTRRRSFTSKQSTGIQWVAEKSQHAQPSKGSRVYSQGAMQSYAMESAAQLLASKQS